MKKIIITMILMLNLIPILDREGITLWPAHTAYGQNQGEEEGDDDEECEEEIIKIILSEWHECYDIYTVVTETYNCETGAQISIDSYDYTEYKECDIGGDDEEMDCAGVIGGTAYEADCGCIGGTTGIMDCEEEDPYPDPDCNGNMGRFATASWSNDCGCTGGYTGEDECDVDPEEPAPCSQYGPSASMDACGTCIGGTSNLTAQTWYEDADNDSWGNSNVTKYCNNAGSGWVLRGGDFNDDCYNLANDANQCCSPQDQAAGLAATNLFADTTITNRIAQFAAFTNTTGQNEQIFRIQDYGQGGGGIVAGPVITLGPQGGNQLNISEYTRAKVHTHTFGSIPAPSATDLFDIIDNWSAFKYFTDSYVVASDSTKYNLHVSDTTKLKSFKNTYGVFHDPVANDFVNGSTLWNRKDVLVNSFTNNNNLSANEAYERALATILEDAGVTLSKAKANSNEFKKIGTEQLLESNGQPKKDANGNNIYRISDCP